MNNPYITTGWGQDIHLILNRIMDSETTFILFFYGEEADTAEIYQAMQDTGKFFMGCMDAGRFIDNQYQLDSRSLVAMSFSSRLFDALDFGMVDLSSQNDNDQVHLAGKQAIRSAADAIGVNLASPDMSREFAINLVYGLRSANSFLEGQGDAGIMLQSVGGSSGGKLDFKASDVMCHLGRGEIAAFGLFRLKPSFGFLMDRISSFRPVPEQRLAATRLAAPRHILEFNGTSAVKEYCRVLKIKQTDLAPDLFARYALGIDPGDGERLITSIMCVDEQGEGFLTYNDVITGSSFSLYESLTQLADRRSIYEKLKVKDLIAFLSFDCILCYLARDTKEKRAGLSGVYADTLTGIPKIGFSTFSENICGANINQTETFLAIYKK